MNTAYESVTIIVIDAICHRKEIRRCTADFLILPNNTAHESVTIIVIDAICHRFYLPNGVFPILSRNGKDRPLGDEKV